MTLALGFVVCCLVSPFLLPSRYHKREELILRWCDITLRMLAVIGVFCALMFRAEIEMKIILWYAILCAEFYIICNAVQYAPTKKKSQRRPYLRLLAVWVFLLSLFLLKAHNFSLALSTTVLETPFILMSTALTVISVYTLVRDYVPPEQATHKTVRLTLLLSAATCSGVICILSFESKLLVKMILIGYPAVAVLTELIISLSFALLCRYYKECASFYIATLLFVATGCFMLFVFTDVIPSVGYYIALIVIPVLFSLAFALLKKHDNNKRNQAI